MRRTGVRDGAAVEIVRIYLRLVEERHLEEARRHLAPEAEITFPGGRRFDDLDAQVAAAAGRYRAIRKVFEGFDVIGAAESIVVYAFGELEGEDLAGRPFAGVRFSHAWAGISVIHTLEVAGGSVFGVESFNRSNHLAPLRSRPDWTGDGRARS